MIKEKNLPLISIIIPCYNVGTYIDDCVSSLVNQTIGLDKLELIFVDDASLDHTLQKLKEWETRYPEQIIVVTYEENKRQGGARNVGMQYATADYVGFVDADDWVEPDMYEELYKRVQAYPYDIVYGKFCRDSIRGNITFNSTKVERKDCGCADKVYHFEQVGKFYRRGNLFDKDENMGGIWSGIYKKSIWIENNIWFPEGMAYEDNYCGMLLNLYVEDMCVVDREFYHYFVNPQSTTSARNQTHQLDRLAIEVGILEEYKERGAFELFYEDLEWNFIRMFYLNSMFIFFTKFDKVPDVFSYMRETVYFYFPDFMNHPKCRECTGRKKFLLDLLALPVLPTYEEMKRIQKAYLESYYGHE